MADFKKGDKVRVSFEAEVTGPDSGSGKYVYVSFEQGSREIAFRLEHVSLLIPPPPPEYKPGDKVCFKDGTEGEVTEIGGGARVQKGFVRVKYQITYPGLSGSWAHIYCPAEELTPIPAERPAPPTGMPPYWIDVEPRDGDTKYRAAIYDCASTKRIHETATYFSRTEAVGAAISLLASQGGDE